MVRISLRGQSGNTKTHEHVKETRMAKMPLFPTQEKALKRILQERERGDLARARKVAIESLEKWPGDYDLAVEAIQCCLDLSDYPQAANLLKNASKRHGGRRAEILELAQAAFHNSGSTLLGSFIIETLLKSRDLEGITRLLETSPESFVTDLTKRCETRSRNLVSEGQEGTPLFAENELLLGILYREAKAFGQAAESLSRAVELIPESAQAIGELIVNIGQELPANSIVEFSLGLASLLIGHPEKAEARFFRSLELERPPYEKILSALESADKPCHNGEILRGEILIRSGKIEEGSAALRAHLWREETGDATPKTEPMELAEKRLAALPPEILCRPQVAFLYCDIASAIGLAGNAVKVLERIADADPDSVPTIIEWLETNEAASRAAPAQALCARLHLEHGDIPSGVRAARRAAEIASSIIPGIVAVVRKRFEHPAEVDPALGVLLAELCARMQDRESAEDAFGALKRSRSVPDGELVKLAGEIMRHCGVFSAGVISVLDLSLADKKIDEALPYVLALYREKPDEHESFAASLRELAEKREEYWADVAGLVDFLAKEEQLSAPFRFLQAEAHLLSGEVERAVFELDQILMANPGLRLDVIDMYGKASVRFGNNATLHLALYHLYLEEEMLSDAARHLCRTLELDPNQIRDVVDRFNTLVEKEPENPGIWEQMLKTSLALNRTSFAKDILKRAIAALGSEKAAALHLYGARLSAAEGRWEDALRCIAVTLTSPHADVRAVEEEIRAIVARDPANPQAYFLLGDALVKIGKEADAVSAFGRCIELSPNFRRMVRDKLEKLLPLSVEPWLISGLLGEISWIEGSRDEAFRYFASAQTGPREALASLTESIERIRVDSPTDARLALLHSRNLSLEERFCEAVSILEHLIGEDARLTREATDVLVSITGRRPGQLEANRLLARIFSRAGDAEQLRQAVVRILSDETNDPSAVDSAVSEFIPLFETNVELLAGYAALKARRGEMEEALARWREAFRLDPERSKEILERIMSHAWPEELADTERMLAADCLIAGHRSDDAFALLSRCATTDRATIGEIVSRLSLLIESSPRRDYFSLGASLLARSGQLEAAERLITEGSRILDREDALTLRIELAEILQNIGSAERASALLTEALDASESKVTTLKRIAEVSDRWADQEIARLSARLESGQAAEEEIAELILLTLDRKGAEPALAILCASAAADSSRSALLGRIYLSMDQPALACAALGAVGRHGAASDTIRPEHLYLEGIARERVGDYGRAAANFSAIAGRFGDHADSRRRALANYTKFLESLCDERPLVLDKTTVL
jgi:tetratricopeptide (TPR) repeat protein